KDRKLPTRENKVRFAGEVCGLVVPATKAGGYESSAEFPFRRTSVLAANRCHDAGAFKFAYRVHRVYATMTYCNSISSDVSVSTSFSRRLYRSIIARSLVTNSSCLPAHISTMFAATKSSI